jgi:hypothetical protein
MSKPMNHAEFAEGIECLVREYISTIRATALQAVERAVGVGSSSGASPAPRRRRSTSGAAASHAKKRRASDEIGTLGERLYAALCSKPGETMTVLAPIVGATARELNRPMMVLKSAGRVRSVGNRHATRYFPMAPRPSA